MATCNVTLDLAYGGDQPYASGSIQVGRAVPADSTTGFVDGSLESVPLANPPTVLGLNGYQPLEREQVYLFVGPTGIRYYKVIPDSPTANFSDLVDAVPVVDPGGSGYLADDLMAEVAADPDSDFRQELDEIFAATAGDVADGAVAALVNSGPDTKAALGDEMDDDSSPLAIATITRVGEAAASTAPTFSPHDYGAVGDGVADDTAAILAAIEAAYAHGGGNVELEHKSGSKYRITDPIVLKARVNLIGSTTSHTSDVSTLIADSATASVWFGQWVGSHEFGGFSGGFLIDGNGSGDPTGLVRFQCVQRSFGQIRVKDGAGHNVVIDNAQNNSFVGLDTNSAPAGSALVLDNGCGGNVFVRCEIGSSDVALTVTDDPGVGNAYPFGPAHNEFHHCIFENYANGTELINLEAGQTRFNGCGFAINDPFTVSSDVMIRISNPLWPTIPTAGEFTSPVFNGGTTAQTNAFAINGANRIILNGDIYFFAHPAVFKVTGENPHVEINGSLQTFEVGALFETSGTGSLYNFRHFETLPTVYRQDDDLEPFGVFNLGRPGDAQDAHRFVLNRDGGMSWSAGEIVGVAAVVYDDDDKGLKFVGRHHTMNGVAAEIAPAVYAAGAVDVDARAYSVHEFYLVGAGEITSMTISNGIIGSEVTIRIFQDVSGGHAVAWPDDVRWARNAAPDDSTGDTWTEVRLRFTLYDHWEEISRSVGIPNGDPATPTTQTLADNERTASFLTSSGDSKTAMDAAIAASQATASTADRNRANHTGTQSLDTTTDSASRLAMTAAERTKVAGVAAGATANDTDANLKNRANHTGTQAQSTVVNLVTDLAAKAPKDGAMFTGRFGRRIPAAVVNTGGIASTFDTSVDSLFELILYGTPSSVTFTNPLDGAEIAVRVYGVGANWAVNWPANVRFAGGVVPTSGNNAFNEIRFRYHLSANSGAGLWLETGRALEVPYV